MFLISPWRLRIRARRGQRARFRILLAAACDECSHPYVEHEEDAAAFGAHTCSECVYEIEHGSRNAQPCHQPIPAALLRRADAAASAPRGRRGEDLLGRGRRQSDATGLAPATFFSLREATAALLFGVVTPRDVVALASDLVAAGRDGASLIALASLYSDATAADVFDLSSATLGEAGMPPLERDGEEVMLLALRVACRRFLDGAWQIRAFTSWVHHAIGHEGPDAAQPLVEFDDGLDMRSDRAVGRYRPEVARLAESFLDATDGLAMGCP